jgi:hypothetical protein
MITKEEQELIDAFYYSNEISRCIFNYKVILSERYVNYSQEEFDVISALVNSIQKNQLSVMQGIDSLRKLYAKGD